MTAVQKVALTVATDAEPSEESLPQPVPYLSSADLGSFSFLFRTTIDGTLIVDSTLWFVVKAGLLPVSDNFQTTGNDFGQSQE